MSFPLDTSSPLWGLFTVSTKRGEAQTIRTTRDLVSPRRRADGPTRGVDGLSARAVRPTRDLVSRTRRTAGPTLGICGPTRGSNGPTRGANRAPRPLNQERRPPTAPLRRPEGPARSRTRPTPRPNQWVPRRRARSGGAYGLTRVCRRSATRPTCRAVAGSAGLHRRCGGDQEIRRGARRFSLPVRPGHVNRRVRPALQSIPIH